MSFICVVAFEHRRSCDLTHFFLWGYVMSLVYANGLIANIERKIAVALAGICGRVIVNSVQLVDRCKRAFGVHMKFQNTSY